MTPRVRRLALAVLFAVAALALVPGAAAEVGQDGAELELVDIDHPEEILLNESLAVTYTIENVGDEPGEEAFVDLLVEGTGQDFDDTDEDVAVPPGETVTGTLVYDSLVGDFDPGDTVSFAVELFETGDSLSGTTDVADEDVDVPELVVDALAYPAQVGPTDDLAVEYTVANVGDEPGEERFVDLDVEGVDTIQDVDENVSVAPGETVDGTLVFDGVEAEFDPGDTIAFAVELFEFGDSASGAVEVGELQLAGIDHPGQVVTDESLVVEYAVENPGEATVDDELLLLVEGSQADSEAVTVPAGETTEGTLVYEDLSAFDPGETLELSVGLAGSGDVDSGTVEVTDNLAIVGVDHPDEVSVDGALDVGYAVENIGAETVTESLVALLVGGFDDPELADSDADVTIDPGETAEGTLSFEDVAAEYDPGDSLTFGIGLDTFEGLETGQVGVVAPSEGPEPALSVDAPNEVDPGEDLAVEYTVENTGDETLADEVEFVVDGETVDSAEITVDPGETVEGTLVHEAVEGAVVAWTVAIPGDEESGETAVEAEGPEPVLSVDAPDEIDPGTDLVVEYTVENTGDESLDDTVEFVVDDETVDSAEIAVDPGETVEGTLVHEAVEGAVVAWTVAIPGDEESGQTAVEAEGPEPGLADVTAPAVIAPGTDLVVEYAVENTGDEEFADEIRLVVGDETVDSADVTVAAGATEDGALVSANVTGETVSFTVELVDAGESTDGTTDIEDAGGLVLAADGPSVVAPGEDLVVAWTVENTGDETLDDTVEFVVDGSPGGSDDVAVDPGESASGSFAVDGETLDPGETVSYTVGLASGGEESGETTVGTLAGTVAFDAPVETDRETLLVAVTGLDGPATLAVENRDTDADPSTTPVENGTVVVPVADLGGVALGDTVEATLLVGDETVDTATATVDPGDNDPTAVFAVPGVLDPGETGSFDATDSRDGADGDLDIVAYRWDLTGDGSFDAAGPVIEHSFAQAGPQEVTLEVENEVGLTDRITDTVVVRETGPELGLSTLDIAGQGSTATVTDGGDVSVAVTNDGSEATVEVDIAVGEASETRTVDLAPGADRTVVFENAVADLDPGMYEVTVSAGDAALDGTVTVEGSPTLGIEVTETNDPVTAGEELTVDLAVENTGEEGTVTVDLDSSLGSNATQVTVDAGETTEVTLAVGTDTDDSGEHELTATAGDATETVTATVEAESDSSLLGPLVVGLSVLALALAAGLGYYYRQRRQPRGRHRF